MTERRQRAASLAVLALVATMGLGACDTWFGERAKPPLPGKRIPVLLHDPALAPDPTAAKEEILLPAPSINPDWPGAGGYANHAMHHIEVADAPKRVWSADVGSGASRDERIVAQPIVADGRIYAMDATSRVSAFDAQTGERRWRVDLTPKDEDEGHIGGGLAFEQGTLFVATGFAQVVALNAATGAQIWRQTLSAPVRAAPTARGGRLFVITVDNKFHAFNGFDGSTLWTHSGISETASLLGGASPAVDQDVVVVPYSSGELVALKVENGRQLWAYSLAVTRRTDVVSALSDIRGQPVIDRGRVFAVSHGTQMVAIDLRSGRRLWDKAIGSAESPWVAGNYIFLVTNTGALAALGREDGRIHWITQLPQYENEQKRTKPIVWTGPLLASDRLIVAGSQGRALAVSPYSGEILGQVEMPDGVSIAPVAANGSIYFLANNAKLVAYR